jgi:hypothetical protein
MPSIENLPAKNLCELHFTYMSMVKLPHKWKPPMTISGVDHYVKYSGGPGIMDALIHVKNPPMMPNPYIWPATSHGDHKKVAETIGKGCKEFCEEALDKFKAAHDMARMQAKFKDWKVAAVCAIGAPGTLDFPLLKDQAPFSSWEGTKKEDNAKAYCKAVAEGLSDQFDKCHKKVMCPGLPNYPAFAAFPGPMAPPMPNVPMPMIAYPSAMMAEITQPKLKDAMVAKLSSKVKDKDDAKLHVAIFDSIAFAISPNFLVWLAAQTVKLVMGKGPTTFGPPPLPAAPVVGGDNIAAPGHLM